MTGSKFKGIIYILLGALIFGFAPILVKLSFEGGGNGITMVFLRSAIGLPFLAVIMIIKKIPFKIPKAMGKEILIAGAFGYGLTAILLNLSYNYIDVSLAVTLHYINPVLVMLGCSVIFREKLGSLKWIALAMGMTGIVFLLEAVHTVSLLGITLSFLSGVSCAFYIIYLGLSNLKKLHFFTVTFYLCLIQGILAFGLGIATGDLTFNLTAMAWTYATIIAVMITIFGVTFFQLGIIHAGPPTASMVATLEPITSIVFGAIILSETLTIFRITGGFLIVLSVVVIAISERNHTVSNQE